MKYLRTIAAGPRRGRIAGVNGVSTAPVARYIAAAFMLAALAVRLASFFPGVPVLHWHGSTAVTSVWGALPHPLGAAGCGAEPAERPSGSEDAPGGSHYSSAALPIVAGDAVEALPPTEVIDRRVALVAVAVRDRGIESSGDPRAPPGGWAAPAAAPPSARINGPSGPSSAFKPYFYGV